MNDSPDLSADQRGNDYDYNGGQRCANERRHDYRSEYFMIHAIKRYGRGIVSARDA